MSESILKALMHLFAIIARPDSNEETRRPLVANFLKEQLNQELFEEYLIVFDNFYRKYQKPSEGRKARKKLSASSVKILTICTLINKELNLKQRIIVLIRLLEFINDGEQPSGQEIEFVDAVASTFNVNEQEYKNLKAFVIGQISDLYNNNCLLLVDKNTTPTLESMYYLDSYALDSPIYIYRSVATKMHIFVYGGDLEMYLNGQLIHKNRLYMLSSGSSIRDVKRKPLYYSDIVSAFNQGGGHDDLRLDVENVNYRFRNGVYGIQKISFSEESGKLVGIMGASGSGKSTLLNVLNGNMTPTGGSVRINGYDVHLQKREIEGIIGYVSQDDLLIEDLTVFQNLYYNTKLCFGNYSKFQLLRLVIETLKDLGLYAIRDMKVGSPLNKKISGGQRKRLNISLELIRKPEVLYLDEPTSGLSSADSENILDLLKELTLQGKLIFVVIHQPSSHIFKMFDRLLLLDQGGYPVYDGDPVDSIVYFKSKIKQADWSASECPTCGTVNPEQIFSIIESLVLDEYGNISSARKIQPHEWYKLYKKSPGKVPGKDSKKKFKLPKITFKIPGAFKQFAVFTQRDILSKLANSQYLLMNLFEAPLLVFFLSYLFKYYSATAQSGMGYMLSKNENLPVYIFMAVIVAIFIGITMSADEIIKDRAILKRETFLNLSRSSYLLSKIFILFVISAYQALTFVLIGNFMLEIKGMFFEYWLVLFSTWAFSVLLGLNISDGFKTSVTIYIIIPFLIIPQIILSGIIVRYEKLNPQITNPGTIPWYGEVITARWAYEALAVEQFTSNKYMKPLFQYDRIKFQSNYKKDTWLRVLNEKLDFVENNYESPDKAKAVDYELKLILNEIKAEQQRNKLDTKAFDTDKLKTEPVSQDVINRISGYFDKIQQLYIMAFNKADAERNRYIQKYTETKQQRDSFANLKKQYSNESLSDFVTDRTESKDILEYNGQLFQKKNLIYLYPETNLTAHFYAPKKKIFGKYFSTLHVNVVVIWLATILLYFFLYFSLLKKLLNSSDTIKTVFEKQKNKYNLPM
ncbi:MAG: ATP-binding cassette domain-containing protein [Bacteroidota bacterium]|nr:ATP-binding cassette domain-containing protein [Bacteroidota bacterium]